MAIEKNSTSRRDFMKTSTAAALGTGLAANLAVAARAFADGDDTVKIGLVGCGGRGTGAATQALSTGGSAKLVAMADAFDDQLENSLKLITAQFKSRPERVAVEKEKRFVGFDAYQKLINSGVDLVILATPPGFRPIHFEAAVKAGKHVFFEKPVATDASGVRQVLETVKLAKQKNLKVGVGLQRHHQFPYLETIKRLHDGAIGDIIALRIYWNSAGVWEPRRTRDQVKSEMEYQMRNWYYYNWLCGDHIVEQHIHNLDVGNWVKGAYPVKAHGMGGRQVRSDKRYGEIFDHHAVEYEYADGSRMFSQCRHIPGCWNSVTEHAHGSKGTADISGARINTSTEKWRYSGPKNNPFQTEHDDLFEAIRFDKPYNEGVNGAMSTMTAILGRLATYSGKPIEFDEALSSPVTVMPESFSWDADPPTLPAVITNQSAKEAHLSDARIGLVTAISQLDGFLQLRANGSGWLQYVKATRLQDLATRKEATRELFALAADVQKRLKYNSGLSTEQQQYLGENEFVQFRQALSRLLQAGNQTGTRIYGVYPIPVPGVSKVL